MTKRRNIVRVTTSVQAANNMTPEDWEYVEYLQNQILTFLGDKESALAKIVRVESGKFHLVGSLHMAKSYDYVATILKNHGPMTPQAIRIKSRDYNIRVKKGKTRKEGEWGLSPRTVNFALRWLLKRNLVKRYRLVQNDQRQPTYEWIGG